MRTQSRGAIVGVVLALLVVGVWRSRWVLLYPFFLIGPDARVPHAHNLILQAGVDLGIPGLVALIGLLTVLTIIALQTVRLARNTSLESLSAGLICGFMIYLIHGLVDHVSFSTKSGIAIWAIMSLVVALYRRHRERDLAR